jgi:hypothetical protein
MERARCKGVKKDGSPCGAPAIDENGFCFAHAPGLAEERAEARAKGGRNKSNVARLRAATPVRFAAVYDRLEDALSGVEDGSLTPGQASAMAALARAMATIMQVGELEMRVKELEAGVTPIQLRDWRHR